jgi:hypothetical protein
MHPPRDLLGGRHTSEEEEEEERDEYVSCETANMQTPYYRSISGANLVKLNPSSRAGDDEDELPDSPVLVPNERWHRESDEDVLGGGGAKFDLARQKLRDLLLADPVLREKAESFVSELIQKAQEEAPKREASRTQQVCV